MAWWVGNRLNGFSGVVQGRGNLEYGVLAFLFSLFHFFPSSSRSSSSIFSVKKNSCSFFTRSFFCRILNCWWKINGILTFSFFFFLFSFFSPLPPPNSSVPSFERDGRPYSLLFVFFTIFCLQLRGLTPGDMYSFERNLNFLTLFHVFLQSLYPYEVQLIAHYNDFTTCE